MPKPFSKEQRQEWEEKINRQKTSGLSIKRWCRQNQIKACSFYYWRDRLFPQEPVLRSQFTELSNTKPSETGILIEYRELRIRIEKHFDTTTLRNCLAVLMEAK